MLERKRLVAAVSGARVVVLEAPGGYGKSTFCAQLGDCFDAVAIVATARRELALGELLAELSLAARRAGLRTLADAIDPDDPQGSRARLLDGLEAAGDVVLAVDDVQRVEGAGREWLAALGDVLPARARLVVAGRRIGRELTPLLAGPGTVVLGHADLRLDDAEVAEVFTGHRGIAPSPEVVDGLLASSDGWPAAIALTVSVAAGGDLPPGPTVFRGLVERSLAAMHADTAVVAGQLWAVPLLSAPVAALLGGAGTLDRLLDAGLPIRFRPDGWGELPDAVRQHLPVAPVGAETARAVAAVYAAAGELAEAALLLHRIGDHRGLAELVGRQSHRELAGVDLWLLDALVAACPDGELSAAPDALVQLVRAAEHQPRLRRTWVERAQRVLPEHSPARRAVDVEAAMEQGRTGDLAGGLAVVAEVLAEAAAGEVVTRARAHAVRATLTIVSDSAGAAPRSLAIDDFSAAASLYRLAGEPAWEAATLRSLGYGCHFTVGAFAAAIGHLERAVALCSASDHVRCDMLTYLAEVQAHAGRLDDADVTVYEADAIARRIGDERLIGYTAWTQAEVACQRRDRAAAEAALDRAERHGAGWLDGLAGVEFLAAAAAIRTIFGDRDGAVRDLARAEERARQSSRADASTLARARLEATLGDPARGLELADALALDATVYPRDTWLRLLLRAVCLTRLGRHDEARRELDRARAEATAMGEAEIAERREPELLAVVAAPSAPITGARGPGRPRGRRHGADGVDGVDGDRDEGDGGELPATVTLLGGFHVRRGTVDVTPPAGHPSALVKLLAARGTVTVDEAIDALWPDADLATGRARLRNLLNRLRAACGPLVDRGDGTLALDPRVAVDLVEFEREAAAVIAADDAERAGRARRALARHGGELLPADHYTAWTGAPRERVRRAYLTLVDIVVDAALRDGALDEACALLDQAIGVDPLDELRYVRLARALVTQGRAGSARRAVAQGLAAADELGVRPGPELRDLAADLHVV